MNTQGQSLAATQRWMHEALILPDGAGATRADDILLASPRLSGAAGLAIYQRGYFLRIASCMREQFPALCQALGDALFDDFVADYVRERPPESYTLYDLGRRFPAHLEENRPDRAQAERESWIDFMVDLATFERAVFTMFDAPGHEGLPFADAATPDDRLRLQPCFTLGDYRFPVASYYHAVRQHQPAPNPQALRQTVALVRTDYVIRTIPINAAEHCFLRAMEREGSVSRAIEALASFLGTTIDSVRDNWASAAGARQRWIELGLFIAVD